MKKKPLLMREGFWGYDKKSTLPLPAPRDKPWKGKALFLKALAKAENKARKTSYKGASLCRICECRNGISEYDLRGWVWPSGFSHYIKEHNVRPSLAFQEFILGRFVDDATFEDEGVK